MRKPNFKIMFLTILLIMILLISGCGSLRALRGKDRINNNEPIITPQPSEDLGDCTVIDLTKDTQQYKQAAGVDPNLLSVDIYTPKTKGICNTKYPIMIYVHGGGWQIGDKRNVIQNKAAYFPSHGYVFVSVNYRLAPEVMYPVFNQDAAEAVKWVYDNADKYSADNTHIIIMGHSAGGGIISSISTDERYLNNAGIPLSTLKCAISLDTEGYNVSAKASENTKVYQPSFGSDETIWPDASPINHISADKGIPSFFIVTRGSAIRVEGAAKFQQKLIESGIYAQLIETPSLDHEGVNAAVGDQNDILITPKLQEFLDTQCK